MKHVLQGNKAKRSSQIKEAFEKLHTVKPNGARNTEWWRRADYSEICVSKNLISCDTETINKIDLFFKGTEAKRTFKNSGSLSVFRSKKQVFVLFIGLTQSSVTQSAP